MKSYLSREGDESVAGYARSCDSSSSISAEGAISLAVSNDINNRPLPSEADPFLRDIKGPKPSTTSFSSLSVSLRVLVSKLLFPLLLVYIYCIICGGSNGLVVGAMPCNISAGELTSLEALYNTTDGDSWDYDDDITYGGSVWTFPATVSDPCTKNWQGVNCSLLPLSSSSCFVNSVVLISYNLKGGPLPKEISGLTGISTLDLHYNYIKGAIPTEVGALTNLQYLDLSKNLLSGQIPSQVSNLEALESLILSENYLTGSIPRYLSTKLLYLDLIYNHMDGTIPSELYFMTALQVLRLFNNSFSGSISSSISNMTSLEWISLSVNQFTGSIPTEIASLTKANILSLYKNQFNGKLYKICLYLVFYITLN
jgi:Leucine-rich repeat (LRR) protein